MFIALAVFIKRIFLSASAKTFWSFSTSNLYTRHWYTFPVATTMPRQIMCRRRRRRRRRLRRQPLDLWQVLYYLNWYARARLNSTVHTVYAHISLLNYKANRLKHQPCLQFSINEPSRHVDGAEWRRLPSCRQCQPNERAAVPGILQCDWLRTKSPGLTSIRQSI